jgi:hypothetical protein
VGLLLACVPQLASAGTGPWILSPGDGQLYAGVEMQRFRRLATGSGSYTDDVIDVDNGVSTLGAKLIGSVGVVRHLEIEAEVPYFTVFAPTTDGPVCTLLGLGACQRTHGFGIFAFRIKALAVDELYGKPLSLAFTVEARMGQLTSPDRERITNLGEGTFDLEPRMSIGRIGGLGKQGSYSLALDVGWRFRFPLIREHLGEPLRVPGWEVTAAIESLFSPINAVAFGPAAHWVHRPNGVDFEDVDLTIDDRFGALRISALNLGGKFIVRGSDRVNLSLGVFHTLYAWNNPSDVLSVSAGVSVRDLFRRKQ